MTATGVIGQIVSLVLLLKATAAGAGISYQLITHNLIRHVSTVTFGNHKEGPLMGSYLIHILLHPAVGYAIAALTVFLIIKEFLSYSLTRKIFFNLTGLFVAAFFSAVYVWVFGHGYLLPPG